MAFSESLLEIIREKDIEAAKKLIIPYEHERHSELLQQYLNEIYGRHGSLSQRELDKMRQLNLQRQQFILANSPWFFMNYGGLVNISSEDELANPGPFLYRAKFLEAHGINQSYQFGAYFMDSFKQVLHSQPDEGLVSILVGRMPAMKLGVNRNMIYPRKEKRSRRGYVDTAVYIYAESGRNRVPGFEHYIDGAAPISTERPILYLADQFPDGAQILEKGFTEEIRIFMPKELKLE